MHALRFIVKSLGLGVVGSTLLYLTPAEAKGRVTAKASAPPKVEAPPPPEPEPEPMEETSEPAEESVESPEEPKAATAESAPQAGVPCAPGAPVDRTHILWIDGGFRWDSGSFSRSEQVGGNRNNDNEDINSLGPMFSVGYLARLNNNMAMGAAFSYGSDYDLNNEDLLIGQLLALSFVADFSAPLTDKFSILGAPRAGISALLPSGILKDRIDENQLVGFDTWSGPRYGFLLGFEAGVRYSVAPWLSLRAAVGYNWNMLFLLDSKAQGQTVAASQSWQVQASRIGGSVGLEFHF
jgi:hypothetical protein